MKKPEGCVGCPFYGNGWGFVPSEGNPQSPWCVLESAGETEEREARPVVGAAGQEWEKSLMAAAHRRRDQVYIVNTIKCRPPRGAKPHQWAAAITQCRQYLEREVLEARQGPSAVVLFGGYAMQGWFGTTLGHGGKAPAITEWRGTLLRQNEWLAPFAYDKRVHVSKDQEVRLLAFPSNPVIVPTIHPSFIIRDAWVERINQCHDVRRALGAMPTRFSLLDPIAKVGLRPWETVIDIETSREDWRKLTLIGILTDGGVKQFRDFAAQFYMIQSYLGSRTFKIGQNLPFDIRGLIHNGFTVRGPFWDTIAAGKLEEPDLDADLASLASRTLPDYFLWKGLPDWAALQRIVGAVFGMTDEMRYNADWWRIYNQIDLYQTARIKQALERRLAVPAAPGLPSRLRLFYQAYVPMIPRLVALTEHGMRPDIQKFQALADELEDELAQIAAECEAEIEPIWMAQGAVDQVVIDACATLTFCQKHPKYNGLHLPGQRKCPECLQKFLAVGDDLRERHRVAKANLRKYEKGFNPGSADHWRWVLYSLLRLPVKEKTDPTDRFPHGQASVDDDVVRFLMNSSSDPHTKRWLGWRLVYSKKQHQLDSFVYNILSGKVLDKDGVLHPDYNSHRTSIGRLSSGGGKEGAEK